MSIYLHIYMHTYVCIYILYVYVPSYIHVPNILMESTVLQNNSHAAATRGGGCFPAEVLVSELWKKDATASPAASTPN